MKACVLCKKAIAPAVAAVELVGGLFDPEDPEFFVTDEDVMAVTHIHRECLVESIGKGRPAGPDHASLDKTTSQPPSESQTETEPPSR